MFALFTAVFLPPPRRHEGGWELAFDSHGRKPKVAGSKGDPSEKQPLGDKARTEESPGLSTV